MDTDTVIIGGGLAGLNCARRLHAAGRSFILLEAADRLGGRVRTETISTSEGDYLVDCGFQVLLTAYPNAAEAFDYDALDLKCFYPGAMVFHDGQMHRVADPRRRPGDALRGFRTPIATTRDKLRLAEMSLRVLAGPVENLWARPDRSAIDALREEGFASTTIDRFFRPFFGGVFFDPDLETSSRMLEFTYRMFAQGRTCVPARGMAALPAQIARRLPADSVQVDSRVDRLERTSNGWTVQTTDRSVSATNIVVAVEGGTARTLMSPHATVDAKPVRWRQTATIAYACDKPPTEEAILVLDGQGEGPINHLASMSVASPAYAPKGKHLVYANVIDPTMLAAAMDDEVLDDVARPQLRRWFGEQVDGWRAINVDRIDHALPDQSPPWLSTPQRPVEMGGGLFACGDWLDNASIDGALASGSRCAQAVLDRTPA
ncbi:MAG: FAD-dependent oxidoreductase [Phycisphaera sp.]|nr:MAG: FAD-dependent oxidoreductase [Phycisphaera sp.]